MFDDTGLPKTGTHSVGVAPQHASMLGKRPNCQTLVSLAPARDEVPVAVGLRLFLPGGEAWLIGGWRSSDERRYDLTNLPAETGLLMLAACIKAGWVCEQAHRQMQEKLGPDHLEGRFRRGLHRHALMIMIACALQ